MASASGDNRHHHRRLHLTHLLHAASTNPKQQPPSSKVLHLPLLNSPLLLASPFTSPDTESVSSRNLPSSSSVKNMPSSEPSSGFPSTVRISTGKGGPAFVGQVFSMCDLSGTGLMAVSTQFDIPFLSKRTPEWLKKMFAAVTKSERKNGPVFRFFMDLGDAVSYVKQLNIPSGVVGACRLDIAYEHFKEKPDLFQFIPNERQVKEANKLLKTLPHDDGNKKVEGVPVFGAQNLDIAIATTDGIKWYTPFFFDKNMLDNILEESVDQHFDSLIQTRNSQRRRDVVDDNLTAEIVEEMGESMWDPPEVQEVMDEMGHPGIPLSVISKAAEIQLFYAVDKVLLGNRWLRKVTGIQPKFPYIVDSFERMYIPSSYALSNLALHMVFNILSILPLRSCRSTASSLRAKKQPPLLSNSKFNEDVQYQIPGTSHVQWEQTDPNIQGQKTDFQYPFGDWFGHPWFKHPKKQQRLSGPRDENSTRKNRRQGVELSPFLPKITMVGISTGGEQGKMSKATIRKTMDDLTRELDRVELESQSGSTSSDCVLDERDPLFVANVGEYYSGVQKTGGAARRVHG